MMKKIVQEFLLIKSSKVATLNLPSLAQMLATAAFSTCFKIKRI